MKKSIQKVRVSDIAREAGVSAGTVDRVLHNRGEVSPESRKRVEDAVRALNFCFEPHSVTPKQKPRVRLLTIIPRHRPEEYWGKMQEGIERAVRHAAGADVLLRFLYYDYFDAASCSKVYAEALALRNNGVIVGPSFCRETVELVTVLQRRGTPVVLVDTAVPGVEPLAVFAPNGHEAGRAEAKLLLPLMQPDKEIAMVSALHTGNEAYMQSMNTRQGFLSYLEEHAPHIPTHSLTYSRTGEAENEEAFDRFFAEHTHIGGVAVFASRAYIVADYLRRHRMGGIPIVGLDLNPPNTRCLLCGNIDFIISEHPARQGYMATTALIDYVIYNKQPQPLNFTLIDVVISETVSSYIDKADQ